MWRNRTSGRCLVSVCLRPVPPGSVFKKKGARFCGQFLTTGGVHVLLCLNVQKSSALLQTLPDSRQMILISSSDVCLPDEMQSLSLQYDSSGEQKTSDDCLEPSGNQIASFSNDLAWFYQLPLILTLSSPAEEFCEGSVTV